MSNYINKSVKRILAMLLIVTITMNVIPVSVTYSAEGGDSNVLSIQVVEKETKQEETEESDSEEGTTEETTNPEETEESDLEEGTVEEDNTEETTNPEETEELDSEEDTAEEDNTEETTNPEETEESDSEEGTTEEDNTEETTNPEETEESDSEEGTTEEDNTEETTNPEETQTIPVSDAYVYYAINYGGNSIKGNAITDEDGYIKIEVADEYVDAIENGGVSIEYSVYKSGYAVATGEISNKSESMQIVLSKGNKLMLHVKCGDKDIAGANVKYTISDETNSQENAGETKSVDTDANGFANIDLSQYLDKDVEIACTICKAGYETVTVNVNKKGVTVVELVPIDKQQPCIYITDNTNSVSDAEVYYMLDFGEESEKTIAIAKSDDNGYVYVDIPEGKDIKNLKSVSYRVYKEGYQVSSKVDDDNETFAKYVKLSPLSSNSISQITVDIAGEGTASIDDTTVTGDVEIVEGKHTVKIVPGENHYIEQVTINEIPVTVENDKCYEESIILDSNDVIAVTFEKEFKINVTYDATKGLAKLMNVLSEDMKTELELCENIAVVRKGADIEITVTPQTGYRVSSVTTKLVTTNNEELETFEDNSYEYNKTIENVNDDISFEIEFKLNRYSIKTSEEGTSNGEIQISKNPENTLEVLHGENATITFIPDENYRLDKIYVNGAEYTKTAENFVENTDGTYSLTLSDIKEPLIIDADFKEMDKISESDSMGYLDIQPLDAAQDKILGMCSGKEGDLNKICIMATGNGVIIKPLASENSEENSAKMIRVKYAGDSNYTDWSEAIIIEENAEISAIQIKDNGAGNEAVLDLGSRNLRVVLNDNGPQVTVAPTNPLVDGMTVYNSDVPLTINVLHENDGTSYDTLASVEYQVIKDADSENAEITQKTTINLDSQCKYFDEEFIIEAEKNNSSNVKVIVTVTDIFGNSYSGECTLSINDTIPSATVEIIGEDKSGTEAGYYNTDQTAQITIVDRADTFNEDSALKDITLVFRDAAGNEIKKTLYNLNAAWQSDGRTHTANITLEAEGIYSFDIGYVNGAGLGSETACTDGFREDGTVVVDKTAPQGYILFSTWNTLMPELTIGMFGKESIQLEAVVNDILSPVYYVEYYKSDMDVILTKDQLEELYQAGEFSKEPCKVSPDEEAVVYARMADYSGNIRYISTKGIIVEDNEGVINHLIEQTAVNGYYNSDVEIKINVDEKAGENISSGIKSVDYKVEYYDEVLGKYVITKSESLYKFESENQNIQSGEANIDKNALLTEWEGNITVNSQENNYDDVKVTITVIDNAGVEISKEIPLSINVDKPVVTVTFDEYKPAKIVDDKGYFGAGRQATIKIEDRASAFDEATAIEAIKITALDKAGREISVDVEEMLSHWENNGSIHTAVLSFEEDANYKWEISGYTNRAGNSMNDAEYTGETPLNFAVDTEKPTGNVTVGNNTWDNLAEILFFGIWANDSVDVSAEADDMISPVEIEYYKTDSSRALTFEELEEKSFEEFKGLTVNPDEQFVIYLKITDYSGNYIYISSQGHVIENKASNIVLKPETVNINSIYNKDVKIKVDVTEDTPYSGIKTIDYLVVKDGDVTNPTQKGSLYTFNTSNPAKEQLINEWTGYITVDAAMNNSSDVKVYVTAMDNAGNQWTEEISLDIDITKPTIEISYNNNSDNGGNGYFANTRTATIAITERTNHFNNEDAKAGISIVATDAKGNRVNIDKNAIISDFVTTEGDTPDKAVHKATIAYTTDANYTFGIEYTDRAGNKNEVVDTKDSVEPFTFTVDTVKPTGSVMAVSKEGREKIWDKLAGSLTFGFYSGKSIAITGTSDDVTSGVASVKYYKSDRTTALTEEQLNKITDWKTFDGLNISSDDKFCIYVRITDNAGNVAYLSTDGLIVDTKTPRSEYFAPSVSSDESKDKVYNEDVKVTITVNEQTNNDSCSGLRVVNYKVLNMGVETQRGTLYESNVANPDYSQIEKDLTKEIVVDSRLNNSNDVVVEIYAEDNSLNSEIYRLNVKIDTTKPVINISYNNNAPVNGQYYTDSRVATVVVTERNFNPEDVQLAITNTNGVAPAISSWRKNGGSGNGDNTTYTADIIYSADGDYTFGVSYKDTANNICDTVIYAPGTANATQFTIDKTLPVISVSYDNNSVKNEKYFNAERTAIVTVVERNFNANLVKFIQTASLDGKDISIPAASWSSNGDVHTALIKYTTDGDYTFDVEMSDMAGNRALEASYNNSAAPKAFTIDMSTEEIKISGVENGNAYKDEVEAKVSFSDINYDSYEVRLTRTRNGEKDIDVTEEFMSHIRVGENGVTIDSSKFDMVKENDGIYTLYIKTTDKAGNIKEEEVKFTINRFGSVYQYSDYLYEIIANGGAYLNNLEKDLVITEYNASRLIDGEIKIEITRDGKPLSDVKWSMTPEFDEDVAVSDGGWFEYQYIISKDNFGEDGIYKISVFSQDEAGNIPENSNDEDMNIVFRVDATAPEITNISGMEDSFVNAAEHMVKFDVYDAIGLGKVTVFVDGKLYAEPIVDFSEDLNYYQGSFSLKESDEAQSIRIVVEDLAGNITDTASEDFVSAYEFVNSITVSTNPFIRWYTDKKLFWGSIGGAVLVMAGIATLIIKRRKKEEAE